MGNSKDGKEKVNKEWLYRIDLIKDSTIFKTLLVVYLIGGGLVGLFMFFLTLSEGFLEALRVGAMVFAMLAGIFLVLSVFSYYAVYVPLSGRYCNVIFKISDEKADFIMGKKEKNRAAKNRSNCIGCRPCNK